MYIYLCIYIYIYICIHIYILFQDTSRCCRDMPQSDHRAGNGNSTNHFQAIRLELLSGKLFHNYAKSPVLMVKLTIYDHKCAMFNNYVELPEGSLQESYSAADQSISTLANLKSWWNWRSFHHGSNKNRTAFDKNKLVFDIPDVELQSSEGSNTDWQLPVSPHRRSLQVE